MRLLFSSASIIWSILVHRRKTDDFQEYIHSSAKAICICYVSLVYEGIKICKIGGNQPNDFKLHMRLLLVHHGCFGHYVLLLLSHTLIHHVVINYNLHCTVMLIFLVVLLTLLLAEHLYIPVSTLIAPVTISSTLTLVTLPSPVDDIFI